jgi:hypothetical protein
LQAPAAQPFAQNSSCVVYEQLPFEQVPGTLLTVSVFAAEQ